MTKTTIYKIWLIKDGEPTPLESGARLFRTGMIASRLAELGHEVTWFTGRFNHAEKRQRSGNNKVQLSNNLALCLLEGCGYKKNISFKRILHQRGLAKDFKSSVAEFSKPDIIVAGFPSPELCLAASKFAKENHIPLVLDIRDPWPDSFAGYFPKALNWGLAPLVAYYHGLIRKAVSRADAIFSISNTMLAWAMSFSKDKSITKKIFALGYKQPKEKRELPLKFAFSATSPLRCVFVGMFGSSYDGETLIRAIKQITAKNGPVIELVLIGDGPKRTAWENQANGASNVKFLGWLGEQQISEQLSSMHVGLIPIKGGITKFWLGNKFSEYLSQGLCLVSSATGEVAAQISELDCGASYLSSDADALGSCLTKYLKNPELLLVQMQNSLRAFYQKFEQTEITNAYCAELFKILHKSDD
jgi:glycosyltransferase involved in cell wall biosynthesis